ncbi:MAG TPA: hypothetical protein VNP73_05330, partial [Actinomycetota bacterium]|nr:hypothetical protein [Actinomycetota bacterium]
MDIFFTILNLTAFYFISETFGSVRSGVLDGAPNYFAFASVGMAMTLVIQTASVGMGTRVREEQLTGTLEYLITQPVTSTEIVLGLTGFTFAFATVRAAFYI